MKGGLRKSMTWLHTWSSLIVIWLLFAIFLTGTTAFFKDEITHWMTPEQHASVPSEHTLDVAVERLQEVAPFAQSWSINLPDDRSQTLGLSWLGEGEQQQRRRGPRETLDAGTGELIEGRETAGGDFLYRFHFELWAIPRDIARTIVGAATMLMFIAIISGIIMHRKIFADFFTFRPGKKTASWVDAHVVGSVLALPFHIMITFSGLILLAGTLLFWQGGGHGGGGGGQGGQGGQGRAPMEQPGGPQAGAERGGAERGGAERGGQMAMREGAGNGQNPEGRGKQGGHADMAALNEVASTGRQGRQPMADGAGERGQQRIGRGEAAGNGASGDGIRAGRGARAEGEGPRGERGQRRQAVQREAVELDLRAMLAVAEQRWQQPSYNISISKPMTEDAQVTLQPAHRTKLNNGKWGVPSMTFDASGNVVEETATPEADSVLGALRGMFKILHEAKFADIFVRWMFFFSGVLGTVMVGSGALLWSIKRERQQAGNKGFELVSALNLAGVAGLFVALATYFWANRLLPVEMAERRDAEIYCFFAAWGLCLLHAAVLRQKQGWLIQLSIAAAMFLLLPVLDFMTSPVGLIGAVGGGDWMRLSFDLVAWFTAAGLTTAVLHQRKKAKQPQRGKRKDSKPAKPQLKEGQA